MRLHYLPDHFPGLRSVLLLMSTLAAMCALIAAAELPTPKEKLETIQQVLQSPASPVTDVLDDERLRLICIAGALGGAVASLCLFLPATVQEMARKLFASSILSIMCTPWLMGWFSLPFRTSYVLASSGAVALIAWSVMQAVLPNLSAWVVKWIGNKTT